MDFAFTEEQQLLQQNLRELVERDIVPGYMERARGFRLDWHTNIAKWLADHDLMGWDVPEEMGGKGPMPAVTAGIIAYELGRGDEAFALKFMGQKNISAVVAGCDLPDEIKTPVLKEVLSGEKGFGCCFTEPHCGTDLGDVRVTAFPDGNGNYILNGTKASVSFADADYYVVMCRMEPDTKGYRGCGLVFVPADTEGVEMSVYEDYGMRQLNRGDVYFKNVVVKPEMVMAAPGTGFQKVMHIFDNARPNLALLSIGCAERVIEQCIEYCRNRESFGRPLAKYESCSFGLAEYSTKLEGAKLIAYEAHWKRDNDMWNAKESAMAKWYGCETAFDAIWFCTRLFGHLGHTAEYDVCQKLLDTMGWAWGDGGWEAQKMVIIREIAGRDFLPYDRK